MTPFHCQIYLSILHFTVYDTIKPIAKYPAMSSNDEKLAIWLADKMLKNGVSNLTLDEIQVAANDKNFLAAYKASTFQSSFLVC